MLNINQPFRPLLSICLALNLAVTRTNSTNLLLPHPICILPPILHILFDQHMLLSTTTITQAPAASKAERAAWNEASSSPSWLHDLGAGYFLSLSSSIKWG